MKSPVSLGKFSKIYLKALPYHINLISDHHLNNIIICAVRVDFRHPMIQFLERTPTRHIVNTNNALCASIIAGSESTEAFLTSGVPNGEFHTIPVDRHRGYTEIDAYSGSLLRIEDVVDESEH